MKRAAIHALPLGAMTGMLACVMCAIAGCNDTTNDATDENVSAKNVTEAQPWFEECARARGVNFQQVSGHRERFLMPEIMAGGAALVDLDGDGFLDIYLVQAGSLYPDAGSQPGNQLFRNRGDGTFEDVTNGSGADDHGYGIGVAAGDYNSDGRIDLYITNVGANVLLRNDGNMKFTDVTSAAGVGDVGFGSSAAFVDVDRDGDLDLYVANYILWSMDTERHCFAPSGQADYCGPRSYEAPAPDVLYANNGDGTFTNITAQAGIDQAFGNGLGVICGDFSGDGNVDIFVANDAMPNQLWVHQDDGTFRDEAWTRGCAVDDDGTPKAGMGVTAVDLDHNGMLDLLVVNLHNEADSLYLNQGDYFIDATAVAGLGSISRPFTRFGVALVDFNNDGTPDLFEANGGVERLRVPQIETDPYAEHNLLLRGVPGKTLRFEEVLPQGGTQPELIATSRAAAFGDIDNDGGVDVLIVNRDGPVHLLRNTVPTRSAWISLRLVNAHGSDAIGAKVICEVGTRTISRTVRSAYSYAAANDPRIHIGLGDAKRLDRAIVTWPNGTRETYGPLDANACVELKQGTGQAN